MPAPKGLLRGSKLSSRHSTVIEYAIPLIEAAKRHEAVSKIVLAEIARVGGGNPRVKFVPIPAGLRMVVRGPNNQQVIFLYTSQASTVQTFLKNAWQNAHH